MKQYETALGGQILTERHDEMERALWFAYAGLITGYRSAGEDVRVGIAVRDAKARGCGDMVRAIWMARRAARLDSVTMTQRQWQAQTRRESRARHHDSVALREKYVRC